MFWLRTSSAPWRALLLILLGVAGAASVRAALDPARLETWNLPRASLFAVTTKGQNAWAVGYWGTVLRSSDGGKSWIETRTPTSKTLFAVSFADADTGWAVGAGGTVLRSTDSGATWTAQAVELPDEMGGTRPLDVNLFGVATLSATEAWAVGDMGTLIHTRDGEHWEKVGLDPAVFADDNVPERILNAVVFTSPSEGWIAGEFATLLRTTDGGATWVGQRTIEGAPGDIYLFNLSATPSGPAAAVGLAGSVLVSSEGGARWDSRSVDTTAGLFAIAWQGERGIAVGDRGVLYVTQDAGQTWTDAKRPKLFNWLAGAAIASDSVALVVGEGGLVLRSEDGGASWSAATTPSVSVEPPIRPLGGERPGNAE